MSNEIFHMNEPDFKVKHKNIDKKPKREVKQHEYNKEIDSEDIKKNKNKNIISEKENNELVKKQQIAEDNLKNNHYLSNIYKPLDNPHDEPNELFILESVLLRKKKELKITKKKKMELDLQHNDILEKVNDCIEQSNISVNNKPNMNNLIDMKIKLDNLNIEYLNAKKQLAIYKQKFDLMKKQSTDNITNDKIYEIEEKISNVKEENETLIKRINQFKMKQNLKSKEIEVYQTEMPLKISKLTEQLNNLASKKFKNFNLINNNKKSLKNLKVYLENMQQLHNNILFKGGQLNPREVERIQQEIQHLYSHLKYPEEEIIFKINSGEFKHDHFTTNHNKDLLLRNKVNTSNDHKHFKSLSPKSNQINNSKTLPLINSKKHKVSQSKKQHFLSLNKFEYLSQRDLVTKPHYMMKHNKLMKKVQDNGVSKRLNESIDEIEDQKENTISDLDEIKEAEQEEEIRKSLYMSSDEDIPQIKEIENFVMILDMELNYDFEHSSNEDFTFLVKKNEEFIGINEKILKLQYKTDKSYNNKMNKVKKYYDEIIRKTKILKQQNDLLSEEIKDLTRLLKLGYEERHLQKKSNLSPDNENLNKINVVPPKFKNLEVKPIKFPKKEYKFFTTRPPDYLNKKKLDKTKRDKSLNSSKNSRNKENNYKESMSNYENESNEEASLEKSQSDYDSKLIAKDKLDSDSINKIRKLKLKLSPSNSDIDLNEIKKKYNMKDINKK